MSQLTLSDRQRAALTTVCDTLLPALDATEDPYSFWRRTASDMGVQAVMEIVFADLPADELDGVRSFLELVAEIGFAEQPIEQRNAILTELGGFNPTKPGVHAMRGFAMLLFYGLPDDSGKNPNWPALGYPGAPAIDPAPRSALRIIQPEPRATMEADVCIVGSGAGGSVIAAVLAERGLRVVLLEAGKHVEAEDFGGLELVAYRQLYLRGGPFTTVEGQVTLLAGGALGGGTRVNYTNCLRTPDRVRAEWQEAGLDGLATTEFDVHLDTVLERIGATDALSDLNGPHQRLREGCQALGYSFKTAVRNADPVSYDPMNAGFMGFGDRSGSKLDTTRTWLVDASAHGATLIPEARVQRVLTDGGRAAGVETTDQLTVRAPIVVLAAGAIETPALLLRSSIGGPACGKHLHLHPAGVMLGVFDEPQDGWWGPPQAAVCDEFQTHPDGGGFLIECPQVSTGAAALSIPWLSGRQHKERMSTLSHIAALSSLVHDLGCGTVELNSSGDAVVHYLLDDTRDARTFRRGLLEMARILRASNACEILAEDQTGSVWARDQDFDAFLGRLEGTSLAPFDYPMFSGHQMGTCRMGADPATSVADPRGELHDAPGVWIGDTSAFPSSCGANPMVTAMALARRTAEAITA